MTATYFDTHCHLNFKRFRKTIKEVISHATEKGVSLFVIPGTDIISSKKAVELACERSGMYAAVGIHPHHVYGVVSAKETDCQLGELELLLKQEKVVAIGEVGLDKHTYQKTVYEQYTITPDFLKRQQILLKKQIELAIKHRKSLVLHNREAKKEIVALLEQVWERELEGRSVFHCCEVDSDLLAFAKKHHMCLGVDGDVTFDAQKQRFIHEVPLSMLVLETDSPFLLPEPLKTEKKYPNVPGNIPLVAQCVAKIKGVAVEEVAKQTTENARSLFNI